MRRMPFLLALLLILVFLETPVWAGLLGQVQTFDEPDHHWVRGTGPFVISSPVPVALGGPGSTTDPFLSILAFGGGGPQSRLSAQNLVDWAGDYRSAGVDLIRMDVNNFDSSDLFLRLLFTEFDVSGVPVSAAFSSNAVFVPGGSGWRAIEFDIAPSSLTPLPTLPLVSPVRSLSNAGELRIFHNPLPFFQPFANAPVVATLGVDNITAAQHDTAVVPEPPSWPLFVAAVFGGIGTHLRRRACSAAAGVERMYAGPPIHVRGAC